MSDDDDAGDIVLPAIALDVETPPPSGQPLVREPVAFSSDIRGTNIPTYQASLPLSSSSQKKYLPGQDPSTAKGKRKRTKRILPFSAQTGRFRIDGTSTQNNDQLLQQQGQGPYHSLYRGTSSFYTRRNKLIFYAVQNNVTPMPIDLGVFPTSNNSTSQDLSLQPSSKRARLTFDQVAAGLTPDFFDTNLLSMPDPILYPSEQQGTPYLNISILLPHDGHSKFSTYR